MRKIDTIIIHCTDTPASMDVDTDDLYQWHVIENGWQHIGYHYLIKRDGTVKKCRDVSKAGAHTKGYNYSSIGIALPGGYGGEFNFTYNQMQALKELTYNLMKRFNNIKIIAGHRDFNEEKACPCFDVGEFFRDALIE